MVSTSKNITAQKSAKISKGVEHQFKLLHNQIQKMTPEALQRTVDKAILKYPWIEGLLKSHANGKSRMGVAITGMFVKLSFPEQDITLHKEDLGEDVDKEKTYVLRTVDTDATQRLLRKYDYIYSSGESALNTKSWALTQKYSPNYPLPRNKQNRVVMDHLILRVQDGTYNSSQVKEFLKAIFANMELEKQRVWESHKNVQSIEVSSKVHPIDYIDLAEEALSNMTGDVSVFPVIVMAAINRVRSESNGTFTHKRKHHNASDASSKDYGDVVVSKKDDSGSILVEAMEVKHNKKVTASEIKTLQRKQPKGSSHSLLIVSTHKDTPIMVNMDGVTVCNLWTYAKTRVHDFTPSQMNLLHQRFCEEMLWKNNLSPENVKKAHQIMSRYLETVK